MIIEAHNLSLRLGERQILDRVSFGVERGESLALVGPNGSGKTSILRCLLGLLPFQGTVTIDGHDAVREPVAARTAVSYVAQRPSFGDMGAREVLAFTAKLRRIASSRIDEVLSEVALTEHAGTRVRTFSGGMQQRLSLALALLADAPVLLFDEPSASLDRQGQETFVAIVQRLRAAGRSIVLASHRPEEVDLLTDRILLLEEGRLLGQSERGVSTTRRGHILKPSKELPRHPAAGSLKQVAPAPHIQLVARGGRR